MTTQQQQLEAEFPSEMVRSLKKGGANLSYVPVAEVIQRLNDVLGPAGWSWRVTRVWRDEVSPEWVLAYGELTATVDGKESTKSGTGGVQIKKTNAGGLVDLGDEAKGSESDALKKAAQRFGVALYLSRSEDAIAYEAPVPARDPVAEGWESAERQRQLVTDLQDRIKAEPEDVQQKMRDERARLKIVWPPTADEFAQLNRHLAALKSAVSPPKASRALEASDGPDETQTVPEPPSGASSEEWREAADLLTGAFPGSQDVSPADPEYVEALNAYLRSMKERDEKAGLRAYAKYAKEKGYPEDTASYTMSQIKEALSFMDQL